MVHIDPRLRTWILANALFTSLLLPSTKALAEVENTDIVPKVKRLIPEVHTKTAPGAEGVEQIVSLGIAFKGSTTERRRELLQLLPELGKLTHLKALSLGDDVEDAELYRLPALPSVEEFGTSSPNITDKGVKYLAGMTNLRELRLINTKVRGPGLAHLKDFWKLDWLRMNQTPLNDSGIPHIVKNFPKLRRFNFDDTEVTKAGFMQLSELHWLQDLTLPDDLVGINPKEGRTKEDRRRLENMRRAARLELCVDFHQAHVLSKQKARAAGLNVPPDHLSPFGSSAKLLINHEQNYDENGNRRIEK